MAATNANLEIRMTITNATNRPPQCRKLRAGHECSGVILVLATFTFVGRHFFPSSGDADREKFRGSLGIRSKYARINDAFN
jgi:hypothetical protein